jgi:hypothetical protein
MGPLLLYFVVTWSNELCGRKRLVRMQGAGARRRQIRCEFPAMDRCEIFKSPENPGLPLNTAEPKQECLDVFRALLVFFGHALPHFQPNITK